MKFHLKTLIPGKLLVSLMIIVSIFLLFYTKKREDNQAVNAPLLQHRKSASAEDRYFNLMNNGDASEIALTEDYCNEGYTATCDKFHLNFYNLVRCRADYVNSHQLQQDHPCVIDIIRRKYLHSPSAVNGSVFVERTDVIDPSAGQSSIVLPHLNNKVCFIYLFFNLTNGLAIRYNVYRREDSSWNAELGMAKLYPTLTTWRSS